MDMKIRAASVLAITAGLTGCASLEDGGLYHARLNTLERPVASAGEVDSGSPEATVITAPRQENPSVETYRVPRLTTPVRYTESDNAERPRLEGSDINVTIPAQTVASFVNTVLGDVLELPYALGPGVAERNEVVTLRSVRDMDPETFFQLFEAAISEYGLAVTYSEGLIQVVERSELLAQRPQFISSRARASTPASLRPVAQFVQLEAIDSAEMEAILRITFPDANELGIQTRRDIGALTISGLSDDVDAALALIHQMDDLRFAGAEAVTLAPRNWEAQALATTLQDVLSIEGYLVTVGARVALPITLLPIEHTNQILIFADSAAALRHVVDTARRLDNAAQSTEARIPQVYQVRSRDAQGLADIVRGVLGEQRASNAEGAPAPPPGQLTVDEVGNRIIFNGTEAEFAPLEALMRRLDTAAPEVLIEVTIAEVTLGDEERFGVEFLLNTFGGDLELRTRDGLGLESGGLSAVLRSGDVDWTAAASSTNSQVQVLSTPRISTRSGTQATVQVGTDVPIITSQRAANTQQTGSTDILQTVQYRETGVILSVEPRVYSDNRIDLLIEQEVSSALQNPNQNIASPIISSRTLTSELTLQDGQTAVLGGLMENRINNGSTGVPGLQNIPLLGTLFSTQSYTSDRTVLLILVTPYILSTRTDRQFMVDFYSEEIDRAFATPVRTAVSPFRGPNETLSVRPETATRD
ncbi:type II secretion system protein GspD [Hyphobacterium sp.]|uniref:type II secretion system protein GspD n=1 Tax=Hyphobacterium sp. TaxID=2004662 RepID=UPI003B518459